MSTLANLNLRVDKLPKENFVEGKDKNGNLTGAVYCNLTIAINDESRFGNNIAAIKPQTKEDRDAKKAKEYIGNGSVFWTDGKIVLAEKEPVETDTGSGLPF